MLVHIPALFSAEEARAMRAGLAAARWDDGRLTAGHRAEPVKRNRQLPLDDPLAREFGERILDRPVAHAAVHRGGAAAAHPAAPVQSL